MTELPRLGDKLQTEGEMSEAEACVAFDDVASASGAFVVHREVEGQMLTHRFGCTQVGVRIDRVLTPTKKALDAGWCSGAIGVEVKAGGKKAGPVILQCIDYMHSAFRMKNGLLICLSACFIFPLGKSFCDIASIMVQHRIGSSFIHPRYKSLYFWSGGSTILTLDANKFETSNLDKFNNVGRKVGSR